MLSTVVKNVLIILLIVLILHFLILNLIQEHGRRVPAPVPAPASAPVPACANSEAAAAAAAAPAPAPAAAAVDSPPAAACPSSPLDLSAPKQELLLPPIVTPTATVSSESTCQTNDLYSYVYDLKPFKKDTAQAPAPAAADCAKSDTETDAGTFMGHPIIRTYTNEKHMTGGDLNGVVGFDGEDVLYESLTQKN